MNIFSFTANFDSEESCIAHFKAQRDKLGVLCNKCGYSEHYWIKSRLSYQCKKCSKRMTLKSGTIMQDSNLSFVIWYKTIFLMTTTKKGLSSKQIQKQLGLKRYEPVWAMVHKIRKTLGNRDTRYTLEAMIEKDESYFTIKSSEIEQQKEKKDSNVGAERCVDIMEESMPLKDFEAQKKDWKCHYFKAKVLDDYHGEGHAIKHSIEEQGIAFTDEYTSYVNIADFVELHVTEKLDKETTKETLERVHIRISNAKRNVLGNNHNIKPRYLQLYLNEFVCKLNRRYNEEQLFNKLVIAGITGV